MKGLSIEEKACRYDEAIERAKSKIKNDKNHVLYEDDIIEILPELMESEDERIRKELLAYCQVNMGHTWHSIKQEDYIAYLEKQGEHANFRNKIQIGDKVTRNEDGVLVNLSQLNRVAKKDEKQGQTFTKKDVDDAYLEGVTNTKNEIEKQYEATYQIRKDIATFIFNYRGDIKDRAKWMDYLGIKVCHVEKQGEQKELNLVEILKHYPKETELYSPLYGKLWLAEVDEENEIITCYKYPLSKGCTRAILEQEDTVSFYSNGTTGLPDFNISKNCMLFLYDIEKQGEQKSIDNLTPQEAMDIAVEKCFEQSKQKPAANVEPIKVGDIITNGKIIGKVDENENNKYHGWFGYDKDLSVHYADIPDVENWHKWTIQDAKDGDMLAVEPIEEKYQYPFVAIYKERGLDYFNSYCFISFGGKFYEGSTGHLIENIHPATKEQCDLLFSKMKEAGYKWDADKKELKKIEQKSSWSEEDEKMLECAIDMIEWYSVVNKSKSKLVSDWLKLLKDRVQSQNGYNPYKRIKPITEV